MVAIPASPADDLNGAVPPDDGRCRKRFLQALREVDAVAWEMDPRSWRFTYVSESARGMFGYPLEQWGEAGFWEEQLVDRRDRDWCVGFCKAATEERRTHGVVYRAVRADGESVWVRSVVHVSTDGDGRPTLLRGVLLDASEEMAGVPHPPRLVLDIEAPRYERIRRALAA